MEWPHALQTQLQAAERQFALLLQRLNLTRQELARVVENASRHPRYARANGLRAVSAIPPGAVIERRGIHV